jgi:hypothetical protein
MAKNAKENQKIQETILDLLNKQGEAASKVTKEFEKQTDAASTVETIVAATKTEYQGQQKDLKELRDIEKDIADGKKKATDEEKVLLQKNIEFREKAVKASKEALELQKKLAPTIKTQADQSKKLGDNIKGFVEAFPGGGQISSVLGLDKLGTDMEEGVLDNLKQVGTTGKKSGSMAGGAFAGLTTRVKALGAAIAANPILALGAVVLAITTAVFQFRKNIRDLANELEVSASAAKSMKLELMAAEFELKTMGFDSSKLKTTLGELSTEFGTMEMITVENAKNIEKMAQEMGVAGTEIVKFNKVMMDLTGASFDVASNIAQSVADLAESEGVAVGRVMKDVASNAETFAKFSMDGADGLARAAVEAAKIGGSLKTVLEVADNVLKLESSLTAQFKAQVITGKQINLEKARQLALDGDISGLTAEIQQIVRGFGDIESMNVIERQSIADSIGISVRELQRISRGEAMKEQESVQDKITITNKLIAAGNADQKKLQDILDGGIQTTDKTINLFQ